MKKVTLLEATLRDGSYAVNYSFTSADTAIICKELENAGFEYIEVGHGSGMNSSNKGLGIAAQTDEEYMQAAAQVLTKAKYGMFCIPGVSRLEDIDMAARNNMGFVRIGTNVTEVESSKDFIKKAKDYGMFVCANFMKSYALSPEGFAQQVKLSESYGADMVYVVDSAGGMFVEDVKRYYDAIRKVSSIPLGFHGHDNLGLAASNSLEAVKMGFDFVDCCLQGLGRSSGNASTELLAASFLKMGFYTGVDFMKILDIGKKYIQPLITRRGLEPLDVILGYSEFHSSYMPLIHKYSVKYNVNPALLIIEMSKIDKVHVDENILSDVAQKLSQSDDVYLAKYHFNRYIGGEQQKNP